MMPNPDSEPVARPRRRKAQGPSPTPQPAANGHAEPIRLPTAEARYRAAREELEAARRELERTGAWDPTVKHRLRRADNAVVVLERGLGYEAVAPEGVMIELSRVREVRGDLTAEMVITQHGLHVFGQRYNLSSGTNRSAVARELAARTPETAVDWREVLEQLCVGVLAQARSSTPLERVGQLPPQASAPRVVDPFLPEGPTLVWAPQGAGKSTLAAAIAVTLEEVAEVIPGWMPVAGGHVLVLDWEASAGEWNDRIARIAAGIDIPPPAIAYRRCRVPLADMVEELAREIQTESIAYLIVDSVEKAAGISESGSTYEDKANRLFLSLDRLAIPSLLIDHVAGDDLRRNFGGPAHVTPKSIGSTLKGAWARATYDLKREPTSTEDRTELVLFNVKVNDARHQPPYEFAIHYAPDRGPIRFERSRLSSPELMAALPQAEQMSRHLLAGSMTVADLAEAMGVSKAQVRALVSRHSGSRFTRLPNDEIGLVMPS